MKYDLEERTSKFSKSIIEFAKTVKRTPVNLPLISQLVRSATSVGANYREANGACSRKDFKNKVFICKKEIKETDYWLELISQAESDLKIPVEGLRREAKELILIFSKIVPSTLKNS